jgi:predicted TIM-barrel fold metal-dependent hydrolase
MSGFRHQLRDLMAEITTVDCHSHTLLRREYYEQGPFDLFTLGSYFQREIYALSDDFPGRFFDPQASPAERWAHLREILRRAGNESYWRHYIVTYRELFGLAEHEVTEANWAALSDCIRTRTADPNWYHEVLTQRARVRTQVKNIPWFEDWEPEYFTAVLRMESALQLHEPGVRGQLEQFLGCELRTLRSLREALAELVARYQSRGAVGIKLAHAYRRTLHSEPVAEITASTLFDRALRGERLAPGDLKRLQDYVIYYLAGLCTESGLLFDIHTGVQVNGCWIPDSNPLLLLKLIQTFPRTRFNLYHGGYPWSREIGMMAKHQSNVWLNMAWMYVISMAASRQVLDEWLDLVPGYRILGFGSDVGHPEFVHGHLVMAKSCLVDVLARKVKRDYLSREAACSLAHQLLHDNAVELYGLA